MTETRCPLCGRETMKARMAHGPPMSAEDVATGVCLHPAHIYDMELPPCEAAGVKRITDLESECAELRKDVSALKRTYMADFLKVAVDALDDVEDAGSHPVGAPGSVKRRAQDIGKRLRATAEALARYGEHDGDCAASAVGAPGDARCTCGYDDAVANAAPPLRPSK